MSKAKERPSERAMRVTSQPAKMTFEQWFEILKRLVEAGSCLIDDIYGLDRIDRVSIEKNSKGQPAGIVFKRKTN